MASYRWVVRKKIRTMEEDPEAHLVVRTGVVRALPALCGERVFQEDFWETAKKKTPACQLCKKLLRQFQAGVVARTDSGRKKS